MPLPISAMTVIQKIARMTALEKSPWSFKHHPSRKRRAQVKNTATATPHAGLNLLILITKEILHMLQMSTWAEKQPRELTLLKGSFPVLKMNY